MYPSPQSPYASPKKNLQVVVKFKSQIFKKAYLPQNGRFFGVKLSVCPTFKKTFGSVSQKGQKNRKSEKKSFSKKQKKLKKFSENLKPKPSRT